MPARAATSSSRVAAKPRSAKEASAADRISAGRAVLRRRHRALGVLSTGRASITNLPVSYLIAKDGVSTPRQSAGPVARGCARIGAIRAEAGGSCEMVEQALDANAAQRRYWNPVAGPRWVASPGFRERRNQESLALLLARLGLTGGESVLEIGCGTGALTQPLAAAVGEKGRVVAVDISEPMLGAARQKVAERGLSNVTL